MPFGYVSGAIGIYNAVSGQGNADDLNADARGGDAARLAFNKEKYQDWKDLYGDLEQNTADFYNSLTPEMYIGAGLDASAKEFEAAKVKINKTIAQRGLGGSGLEADINAGNEVRSAEARAKVRVDAPFKVAEAKSNFLSSVLPSKTSAERGVDNAMSASNASLRNQANAAQDSADSAFAGVGDILGAGLENLGRQPNASDSTGIPQE